MGEWRRVFLDPPKSTDSLPSLPHAEMLMLSFSSYGTLSATVEWSWKGSAIGNGDLGGGS